MLPGVEEVCYVTLTCGACPIQSYLCLLRIALQKKVKSDDIYSKIVPVALFFAFSLVLSNKAYIYLSVSYLQVI